MKILEKIKRKSLLLGILFTMLFIGIVYAATSYQVNSGAQVTVDEWSVCKKVTNNNALAIFVPTNTADEWTAFRNYASGVSYADCCSGSGVACTAAADCCSGLCGICTPTYGTAVAYGYDGSCVWKAYVSGVRRFTSAGTYPVDTTHCKLSGVTCTAYAGGYDCPTIYHHYGCQTGNMVYCPAEWSDYYSAAGSYCSNWLCRPMTGCTLTQVCQ